MAFYDFIIGMELIAPILLKVKSRFFFFDEQLVERQVGQHFAEVACVTPSGKWEATIRYSLCFYRFRENFP